MQCHTATFCKFGSLTAWVQLCHFLAMWSWKMWLNFSVPQFPHLENRNHERTCLHRIVVRIEWLIVFIAVCTCHMSISCYHYLIFPRGFLNITQPGSDGSRIFPTCLIPLKFLENKIKTQVSTQHLISIQKYLLNECFKWTFKPSLHWDGRFCFVLWFCSG